MRNFMCYKLLFRSKSLSLTGKILLKKNMIFAYPKKQVFCALRTRNARAQLLDNFPIILLGPSVSGPNFRQIAPIELLKFDFKKDFQGFF